MATTKAFILDFLKWKENETVSECPEGHFHINVIVVAIVIPLVKFARSFREIQMCAA